MKLQRRNSKKTIKIMIIGAHKFLTWLEKENIKLENIDQKTIDKYLSICYKKFTQNTMVVITANLRKFCKHFLKKEIDIKLAKSTAPNRDKTSLTKNEIKEIFKYASENPLESTIIKTLYYTGIRCSELINLDIEDIDLERLQITIKHGKGDKTRTINMTHDCARAIQHLILTRSQPKQGHENALFISTHKTRISATYIYNVVKRNAAKAGITTNMYPHKFRITHITHMIEAGLSISEIQSQTGHSDIQTLVGYIQHTPSRIRKSYNKTFNDIEEPPHEPHKLQSSIPLYNEEYKKIAVQKYLEGEIDARVLHQILDTIESKKDGQKTMDLAYQ